MPNTRGIPTWEDALAEAMALIKDVPTTHRLIDVSFGTFADRIGGGHYVSLRVNYELGNTATAGQEHGETDRKRTAQIAKAWSEAVAKASAVSS
jgi:hypothetical protein